MWASLRECKHPWLRLAVCRQFNSADLFIFWLESGLYQVLSQLCLLCIQVTQHCYAINGFCNQISIILSITCQSVCGLQVYDGHFAYQLLKIGQVQISFLLRGSQLSPYFRVYPYGLKLRTIRRSLMLCHNFFDFFRIEFLSQAFLKEFSYIWVNIMNHNPNHHLHKD